MNVFTDHQNGNVYKIKRRHFKVVDIIGKGTFGMVKSVKHIKSQRIVAAKIINIAPSADEMKSMRQDLKMFEFMGNSSPHIIKFYGIMSVKPDEFWILMEQLPTDLNKIIKWNHSLEDTTVGSPEVMNSQDSFAASERHQLFLPDYLIRHVAYCVGSGILYLKNELNMLHRYLLKTR